MFCTYTLYTFHTATCIKIELHNLYNLQKTDLRRIIELRGSEFLLFLLNKAEIPIWVALGETRDLIRFARSQGSIADLEGTCYCVIWKQERDRSPWICTGK